MDVEKQAIEGRAVTVSGTHPETEDGLIGQRQWQDIHERHASGQTISAIGRDLDLDRKTVRTCLRQACWTPYQRSVAAGGLLDAHRQWLVERAPQVHYSARILYQELIRQRAWMGSYETVKLAVRPLRAAANLDALTQRRFETAPGEQAQVDWGQVTVPLAGVPTPVHFFVMTLGYSRRAYAEGFLHERLPNLLAAHEHAFAHFGGVCHTLLYDRMRTVALGTHIDADGRRKVTLNASFEAFAAHWGFTPRLCRPYRAKTKGKVERSIREVKEDFLAWLSGQPFPERPTLAWYDAQARRWALDVVATRRHRTTKRVVSEAWEAERPLLTPVSRRLLARMAGTQTLVPLPVPVGAAQPAASVGQTVEVRPLDVYAELVR